jgi:hypothetical protein
MEQENIMIDEITRIVNKIKKDWERVTSNGAVISKIDKDILITDLKIAYELASELNITRLAPSFTELKSPSPPEPKPKSFDFSIPAVTLPEEEQPAKPADIPKFEEPAPPGEQPMILKDSMEIVKPEAAPEPPKPDYKPGFTAQKTMGDLFSPPKTVSDLLQGNGHNSLASKIQQHRISDIKAAIGINDKFTFINDLFKGEIANYNQSIEKLNKMVSYQEAMEYVAQLGLESGAPENIAAFAKFTELIKRRYQA